MAVGSNGRMMHPRHPKRPKSRRRKAHQDGTLGEQCYLARRAGAAWKVVALEKCGRPDAVWAFVYAQSYALARGLEFPPDVPPAVDKTGYYRRGREIYDMRASGMCWKRICRLPILNRYGNPAKEGWRQARAYADLMGLPYPAFRGRGR